jgi:hypothetical protein
MRDYVKSFELDMIHVREVLYLPNFFFLKFIRNDTLTSLIYFLYISIRFKSTIKFVGPINLKVDLKMRCTKYIYIY